MCYIQNREKYQGLKFAGKVKDLCIMLFLCKWLPMAAGVSDIPYHFRKQPQENTRADWSKNMFL